MNVPPEWLVSVGGVIVGAVTLVWQFFTKQLEKFTDIQNKHIERLEAKQEKCEETSLGLTSRVARLEGEHDAVMRVSAEVLEEIRKLGEDSNGSA